MEFCLFQGAFFPTRTRRPDREERPVGLTRQTMQPAALILMN